MSRRFDPQHGIDGQLLALVLRAVVEIERADAPPTGLRQADHDLAGRVRANAQRLEGVLRRRDLGLRVEAAGVDLRLVVQELDLDLRVRHRLAVGEHDGAKHAADPVRIGLVERHDLDRQAERLVPRARQSADVHDRLRDLLDVLVLLPLVERRRAQHERVVTERARDTARRASEERRGLGLDARPLDRLEILHEVRHPRLRLTALADDVEGLGRAHVHREAVVEGMREHERELDRRRLVQGRFRRVEQLEVRLGGRGGQPRQRTPKPQRPAARATAQCRGHRS